MTRLLALMILVLLTGCGRGIEKVPSGVRTHAPCVYLNCNTPPEQTSPPADPGRRFFLYASLQASGKIAGFALSGDDWRPVTIAGSPFVSAPGTYGLAIHPNNRFLYATNYDDKANVVSAFAIQPDTGVLALVGKYAAGRGPTGIVFHPSGRFLYVTNWRGTGTISAYEVDSEKGSLTRISGSPFRAGASPRSVEMDPQGRFLFVANNQGNSISVFKIDSATGALSPVPGSPFTGNGLKNPDGLAAYRDGSLLFVGNAVQSGASVSSFLVNPQTGALSPARGSPFSLQAQCREGCGLSFFPGSEALFVVAATSRSIGIEHVDPLTGAIESLSSVVSGGIGASLPNDLKFSPSGHFAYVVHSGSNSISAFEVANPAFTGLFFTGSVSLESQSDLDAGTLVFTH